MGSESAYGDAADIAVDMHEGTVDPAGTVLLKRICHQVGGGGAAGDQAHPAMVGTRPRAHGAFVLTRVDPLSSDTLFLDADARKIRIVNGEGSVTIRLTSAESDAAALEPVTDWSFTRRNDQEYCYKEFPLTGSLQGPTGWSSSRPRAGAGT